VRGGVAQNAVAWSWNRLSRQEALPVPTPKELALRALNRTGDVLFRDLSSFPLDRWREKPGGQANDLFGILLHLIQCEPWWLDNIGILEGERPPLPKPEEYGSAEEMVETLRKARGHRLELLEDRPEGFFEDPVPTCKYGHLHSGAELFLYAAEHDFYHVGQINMLQMALT
jgi:uncharacterized damage-inducible protein DinB